MGTGVTRIQLECAFEVTDRVLEPSESGLRAGENELRGDVRRSRRHPAAGQDDGLRIVSSVEGARISSRDGGATL